MLSEIIHQITTHLGINNIEHINVEFESKLRQYNVDEQPVKLVNNVLYIKFFYLYDVNDDCGLLNFDDFTFEALLCREFARYYLEINSINNKSKFFEEMTMCYLGLAEDASLIPHVSSLYWNGNTIQLQKLFVSTQEEIVYANSICGTGFIKK